MMIQQSLQSLLKIFDCILTPQSNRQLKDAEREIERLSMFQGFEQEMLCLSLRGDLKEEYKIVALCCLKTKMQKRPVYSDIVFIRSVFEVLGNPANSVRYKLSLIEILNTANSPQMRSEIKELTIQMINCGELNHNNPEVIFLCQYILSDPFNYTETINFSKQILNLLGAIGSNLLNHNNQELLMLQLIKLFQTIVLKLKYMTELEIENQYSQEFIKFLTQILEIKRKNESITIIMLKQEVNRLIMMILSEIDKTVSHNRLHRVPIIQWLPSIIDLNLNIIRQSEERKIPIYTDFIGSCLSLMQVSMKIHILQPLLDKFNSQIINICFHQLTLKRQHYECYYRNPQQFINLFHQVMDMNDYDSLQQKSSKKERQTNIYITSSDTLRQLCKNQQKNTIHLIEQIFEILETQKYSGPISQSTCLIMLGILQPEIKKRPHLLRKAMNSIFDLLDRSIPTKYTEEPQNIHFTIGFFLVESYFKQMTFSDEIQSKLFILSCQIIKTPKVQTVLFFQAINIIKHFLYRYSFQQKIVSLLNQCILTVDQPLHLHKILRIYSKLIDQISPLILIANYSPTEMMQRGTNAILRKITHWISDKYDYLINESINILCQSYKFNRFSPINRGNRIIQNLCSLFVMLERHNTSECLVTFSLCLMKTLTVKAIEVKKKSQSLQIFTKQQQNLAQMVLQRHLQENSCELHEVLYSFIETVLRQGIIISQSVLYLCIKIALVCLIHCSQEQQRLINYKYLLILQQILIYHSPILSHQELVSIYNQIKSQADYYCLSNSISLMGANLLNTELILYTLIKDVQQTDEQQNFTFLKQIISESTAFASSKRTAQITSIILSKLMTILNINCHLELMSEIFKTILGLLATQLKSCTTDFQQSIEQANENSLYLEEPKSHQKINIDQWVEFRKLIEHLQAQGLWIHITNKLNNVEKSIFKKSLLCCRFENQTRMIFRVKQNVNCQNDLLSEV